jgi:lipopolysaccharide export LptBFGC system permease protein LptF
MRLPTTLLWHITAELVKLLVVTTGVLVLVLSFAASIKFLADGKLAPADVPVFMAYTILPMLAYALPFASCFAATLVYHRLATDNEAQAAGASGISHRALLIPAAVVGLVLACSLAALNEQVIPRFWRSMQKMITLDVARMLVKSVNRGESLALGNRLVYAEDALRLEPESGRDDGIERFALSKAVVVEFDGQDKPVMQGTAEWVYVTLSRVDRPAGSQTTTMTRVECRAKNLVGRDRDRAMIRTDSAPFAAEIPDAFEDDPKFLTFGELRELRTKPESLNFIERRRRTLALETARLRVIDDLEKQARDLGRIVLSEQDGRTVTVQTSGLVHDPDDPPGVYRVNPPKSMTTTPLARTAAKGDARGSGGAMRVEASGLKLLAAPAEEITGPALQFKFETPEGRMVAIGAGGEEDEQGSRKDWTLSGLSPKAETLESLQRLSVPELLAAAESTAKETRGDPTPVKNAAEDLRRKERDLQNEVTSKQHERWAQAVCCLLMIVTGAVVALRLSLSQPLAVYLWSFLPALLCYITIAGGQQTTHGSGESGLILLWAGVVGLAAYTLLSFRSVARH